MSAKWFKCPDGQMIPIATCLQVGGCRMPQRCATIPFLTFIGYDRKWEGVSPSSAGNGPRMLYLKATTDYVVDPNSRVFAALGTGVHGKLSIHSYTKDALSEEKLSDDKMKGIADCLETDETDSRYYVLTDYKTSGSYKVAKWLGIIAETKEETLLDENDKPILLKSGKNKGQPKTRQNRTILTDPIKADMREVELQINRYRLLFEKHGFPISRMQIQAIPRDGGTYIAKNRGIDKNLYIIPVRRLQNKFVLEFYQNLSDQVNEAFKTGYARQCNIWEAWDNRNRCENFCEVKNVCIEMSKANNERWGLL